MKFKRMDAGVYKSENGYRIVVKHAINKWTGRQMASREDRWLIYKAGEKEPIDWAFTLKEAKKIAEKLEDKIWNTKSI